MQQSVGKARLRLQRMAESMAEVKQRAQVERLALVLGDDPRLHRNAGGDGVFERGGFAGEHLRAVRFQPAEEGRIAQQAILEHLGITGAHFAIRQSAQHQRIDQHQRGLVEGADQVLARPRIDRGLAADRAVDLCQQRGRHLHEAAAALHDRAGEAHQITHHPAAECNHVILAGDAERQQPVAQLLQHAPGLGVLARFDHEPVGGIAGGGEIAFERFPVEAVGVGIGHHRHCAGAAIAFEERRGGLGEAPQQPFLDHHLIGAPGQRHFDHSHWSIASMMARAVSAWGPFSLTTRMGASA